MMCVHEAYDAAAAGRRLKDACAALKDSANASLIEPVAAIEVTRVSERDRGLKRARARPQRQRQRPTAAV